MKTHTNNLKTALKTFPLQTDEKITYGNVTLNEEKIVDIQFYFSGSLLKSLMKGLTIECTEDIAKDTIVRYQKGIKVGNAFEYLDYGNYVVVNSEKKEDSNTYLITCYDKLIYSAIDYVDIGITYPVTIGDYLEAICTYLNITLKTKIFKNTSRVIPEELYLNLGYKFRDVLDEISQAVGGSLCLDINDELEVRTPVTTNDTIDEDFILDINAKFGEKYGPINSIVLSRSAESDNVYLQDAQSIAQNGLCELKIIDNQIMNRNDRSDYLQGIADNVFGIEYYKSDFSSSGVYYYDFLDKFSVSIDNTLYPCLMLNDDVIVTDMTENIYSEIPDTGETDYSKADSTDKKVNKAYIIVDKMKGEIDAKVDKDGIIAQLNVAVEDNQGVITIRGNKFILETDNASIDKYGNTTLENVNVKGGSIEIQDDGTEDNAGIKINTIYQKEDDIVLNSLTDLDNKTIVFHFKNKTYNELIAYNDIVLFSDSSMYPTELKIKCYEIDSGEKQLDVVTKFTYDHTTPEHEEGEVVETIVKTIKFENGIISEDFTYLNDLSNYGLGQIIYVINDPIMNYIKYRSIEQNKVTNYGSYGIDADILGTPFLQDIDSNMIRQIIDGTYTPTQKEFDKCDLDKDGFITENDYDIMVAYENANILWDDDKGHIKYNFKFPKDNIVATDGQGNEVLNYGLGTGLNVNLLKVNGQEIKPYIPVVRNIGLNSNTSYTISSILGHTPVKLDLDLMNINATNKLSYSSSNGYITIGSGVNHVRVNANIMFRGIAGTIYGEIQHNSTRTQSGYATTTTTSGWAVITLSTRILAVNQGDTIKITIGSGSTGTIQVGGGGGQFTYLNVEVID